MTRKPSWPEDLYAYLQSRMAVPFEWGVQDCATFAAGAIEAMTGSSVFTATYSDARGAAREINARGGLENWMTRQFGAPIARLQAKRGDIALIAFEDRDVLSVVMGAMVAAPAKDGVLFYPLTTAKAVWST